MVSRGPGAAGEPFARRRFVAQPSQRGGECGGVTGGHEQRVDVRATGTVAHVEIPALLAAMDVALVLASPVRSFHYSPL